MNENQENIYNDYLRAYAQFQNRPYRKRKNFTDMDKATLAALDKLERFFDQYKHIEPFTFFKASFDTTDKQYIRLEDFTKYSAITAYTRWSRGKYEQDVDSENALKSFMEGIAFIRDFIVKTNIRFSDYKNATNSIGVPWYIIHLNEQKISLYHLHFLKISFRNIKAEYHRMIMADFETAFDSTLQNYMRSEKMKDIANKAFEQLSKSY